MGTGAGDTITYCLLFAHWVAIQPTGVVFLGHILQSAESEIFSLKSQRCYCRSSLAFCVSHHLLPHGYHIWPFVRIHPVEIHILRIVLWEPPCPCNWCLLRRVLCCIGVPAVFLSMTADHTTTWIMGAWKANGTRMERGWNANGAQMDCAQKADGTRMEQTGRGWNADGTMYTLYTW